MGAAQETKIIKNVFLFGVLPLVLFGVGMTKVLGIVFSQEEALSAQVMKLSKYHNDGFSVPSEEMIHAQQAIIDDAKEQVSAIYSYSCAPAIAIPDEIAERAVYFKEKLYLSQRELFGQAQKAGLEIPVNVGFEDRLPDEDEVPVLLMQLQLVEELVGVAIDSNVEAITLLEMLESRSMKNASEKVMACHNISVRVEMTCSSDAMVKTLYGVGNMSPFVVVDSILISQGKDGRITLAFVMTRLAKDEGGK